MKHAELNLILDEIIELPPRTITSESDLTEFPGWDSLAVLSFIAILDERLKIVVSGKDVTNCTTAAELAAVLGDHISG